MSVFTTVSRKKLRWQAPETVSSTNVAAPQFLLIADGFYLDIGSGNKLQIQAEVTPKAWTNQSRTVYRPHAPATVSDNQFLDIGDGFNLLIDDDNKLVIGATRGGNNWTNVNRRNPLR